MDKISNTQASQLNKLAAASLRVLSEENQGLKQERDDLKEKVAHFEKKEHAEKLAAAMDEKGIQPELSFTEKVAKLMERKDLTIVEQAIEMNAPQIKLGSVHEDGTPDVSPTGDDSGNQAEANFIGSLLRDD